MNPYEALIGAPPSTEDAIRAAAARLRGMDDRAILAMLSGDRILAPIGAAQYGAVQKQVQGLRKSRQAMESLKSGELIADNANKRISREGNLNRGLEKTLHAASMLDNAAGRAATFAENIRRTNADVTAAGLLADERGVERADLRDANMDRAIALRNEQALQNEQDAAERAESRRVDDAARADLRDENMSKAAAEREEQVRLSEEAALDRTETRYIEAAQRAAEQAKADAETEKTEFDNVRRLGEQVTKSGVVELESATKQADEVLGQYFNVVTGERTPLGRGGIPGRGRLAGAVHTGFLNDRAQGVRLVHDKVQNILIKARAGTAATAPEMQRVLKELGTALGQGEEQLIRAYVNFRITLAESRDGIYQGFGGRGSPVVRRYESNAPGVVDEDLEIIE